MLKSFQPARVDRPADKGGTAVRRGLGWLGWHLVIPLAFVLVLFFFHTYRVTFQMNSDEGINLMKSMLVAQGYPLYDRIWSDQPPLFTYLLVGLFRFTGFRVSAARFLVLVMSAVLLWACVQFLRLVWGKPHILLGMVVFFLLPAYLSLSVSVMIGLPSLLFAVLSLLALAFWHRRRQERWIVLSALAFSLSLLTKLFTGFLAPIFLAGILLETYLHPAPKMTWGARLRPAILWAGLVGILLLAALFLFVGPANLGQLVGSHLAAGLEEPVQGPEQGEILAQNLMDAWPMILLAIPGSLFVIKEQRWLGLYLVAWMASAFLVLAFHQPLWYHHQLLITIPAAMLAAIAVGETVSLIPRILRSRAWSGASGLLCSATLISLYVFLLVQPVNVRGQFDWQLPFKSHNLRPTSNESNFLRDVLAYAPQTHWMLTDLPMYAFWAGLPVPPDLAVFSSKRVSTGNLTAAQVLAVAQAYQPEQVLMGRFDFPQLDQYLEAHYRLVRQRDEMRLYVRNDLPPY